MFIKFVITHREYLLYEVEGEIQVTKALLSELRNSGCDLWINSEGERICDAEGPRGVMIYFTPKGSQGKTYVSEQPVYVLNDNGKTIEKLI